MGLLHFHFLRPLLFLFTLFACCASIAANNPCAGGVSTSDLLTRWSEYRSALKAAPLKATVDVTWYDKVKKKQTVDANYTIKQMGTGRYAYERYQRAPTKKEPEALVSNAQYSFSLTKRKDAWICTNFLIFEQAQRTLDADNDPERFCDNYLLDCQATPGFDLFNLVQDPEFQITKLFEEGEHVVLTFSTSKVHKKKDAQYSKGRIVLLPNQNYSVSEYEIDGYYGKNPNAKRFKAVGSKRYTFAGKGSIPVIAQNKFRMTSAEVDEKYDYEITTSYAYAEPSMLTETDFMLTAYGLPEPALPSRGGEMPWFLVASALGVVCLLLAIYFQARVKLGRTSR